MKHRQASFRTSLFAASVVLAPALASAHPGHESQGFASGVAHPFQGLDHVLAMVAVGMWAAQLGGRAKWLVSAAFIALMAAGSVFGGSGATLSLAGHIILSSTVILGLIIALASRLHSAVSATLIGLFALAHGCGHGADMNPSTADIGHEAGFMTGVVMLQACGFAFAHAMQRAGKVAWLRVCGAAMCLAGLCSIGI